MDILKLLTEISSVLALIVTISKNVSKIWSFLKKLWEWFRGRSYEGVGRIIHHPLILAASLISLFVLCGAAITAIVPTVSDTSVHSANQITAANLIANIGLVASLVPWIGAVVVSVRLKQWAWGASLIVMGIFLYCAAYFLSDFTAYLSATAIPGVFSIVGPRQSDK